MNLHCQGLCLYIAPHGEHDAIVSVFTESAGVVRAFAKGIRRPSRRELSLLCRPGAFGEWELQQGRSDLWRLVDGALLLYPDGLYASWEALQSALKMFQAVNKTQWCHKPSPQLFALTMAFLLQINREFHPNLPAAYFCKLLLHEGSFPPEHICQICGTCGKGPLYCSEQGLICSQHPRPEHAIEVSTTMLEQLEKLVECRSFNDIRALELDGDQLRITEMLLSNLLE